MLFDLYEVEGAPTYVVDQQKQVVTMCNQVIDDMIHEIDSGLLNLKMDHPSFVDDPHRLVENDVWKRRLIYIKEKVNKDLVQEVNEIKETANHMEVKDIG